MNYSLHCQLALIVITVLNVYSSQTAAQDSNEEKDVFPADFMRFLKSLEPHSHDSTTTRPALKYGYERKYTNSPRKQMAMKSENILNTQKAALRDVLMMKLVSYYEDKYRISHHDTMTPRSSFAGITRITTTKMPVVELDNGMMIPRRTLDVSRVHAQDINPTVAEVVVI